MIIRYSKDFPRGTVPRGTNFWHGFLDPAKREMCNAPSSTHLSWESITRIEPASHWPVRTPLIRVSKVWMREPSKYIAAAAADTF